MMMKNTISRTSLLTICFALGLFFMGTMSYGQMTIVRGQVKDAQTGEPLISAAINFKGTTIGTNTDFDGNYELKSTSPTDKIEISYLGYQTLTKNITVGKTQTINVALEENSLILNTAVVTVEKERYRNKDNPSVQLMRKVIAAKDENRPSSFDYYSYEKYEKIMLGLSNVSDKFKKRRVFKNVKFLFENMDTSSIKGKEVLPVFLKETLSDVMYRKSPEVTKEIVLADTMVTFEGYADDDGFNAYLDNLYQDIDIYNNNILVLDQQFLSPLAKGAPTFYKFYIQDTVQIDGIECIEMFFAPRNKLDILFQGTLYIAYLDNYHIKELDMATNSNINLNWLKSMNLHQEFEKRDSSGYVLVKDAFSADFGLTKKGMGMYGRRSVSSQKIKINEPLPDEVYKGGTEKIVKLKKKVNDVYWKEHRHDALSKSEETTYKKIDSLENLHVFKRAMNIATFVLSGYTKVSPYFEVGPVNTFYSFNPVEGFRLRAGGRTRPELSQKFELETYGAYGFKDKRYKGYLGLSHAVFGGNLHKFPIRRILASAQYETKIPGQQLQFVQEDNILLSFKRGTNDKYLYNTNYVLEYMHEFDKNVTFSIGVKNWEQKPAGGLIYKTTGPIIDQKLVDKITVSEINTILKWAPNEKFYQGKTYRKPIINRYPVFTLRYNLGIKGIAGGEFNYHNLSFSIFKRFNLSRLGYSDMRFNSGMIIGKLPYPLMSVHVGNQTYSYQLQGYNLMNFMEFVSDRYVSLNIDHNFGGIVLNRIPLIKHLKLREVFNVRILYGGIKDENDPSKTDGLIGFPTDEDGNVTTFSLESKPYIEGGFGVANLFKFFRVDVIRRFNYLDNPGVTPWGVRARFKIYF